MKYFKRGKGHKILEGDGGDVVVWGLNPILGGTRTDLPDLHAKFSNDPFNGAGGI